MQHRILPLHRGAELLGVANIAFDDPKLRVVGHPAPVPELVVDGDVVVFGQQTRGQLMPNVAGAAGDKNVHAIATHLSLQDGLLTGRRSVWRLSADETVGQLDGIAGGSRVLVEHAHGLAGVDVEILADERQLLEHVGRDRNDVAADLVGLEDVEKLARARPQQLRLGCDWREARAPCACAGPDRGRCRRCGRRTPTRRPALSPTEPRRRA